MRGSGVRVPLSAPDEEVHQSPSIFHLALPYFSLILAKNHTDRTDASHNALLPGGLVASGDMDTHPHRTDASHSAPLPGRHYPE